MRILRDSFGFLELGVSLGVQFEDFFRDFWDPSSLGLFEG